MRMEKDSEFKDLSTYTARTLRAFKKAAEKHDGAPTVCEILDETDLSKSSMVVICRDIDRLIAAGYVRKVPQNKIRGLRLTDKAFPESRVQPTSPLPDAVDALAGILGIPLGPSPEGDLHATVGAVELTVNTRTGAVVLRHKDGTRLSLGLPPGDPVHRKAAFADLLWILQGAAAK